MRPDEIPRAIYAANIIKKNVIFEGPPGVGKTVAVLDYARALAEREGLPMVEAWEAQAPESFSEKCPRGECVYFVYVNINTSLPVDLSGIPEKRDGYVEWVPLYVWYACRRAKHCIVFIDEYNTSENPDMFATVMRLLGECRAGNIHLGCGAKEGGSTIVIAAGNPSGTNAVAVEPPSPLLGGKAVLIRVEPPSLPGWIRYMERKYPGKWCPRVAAFLASNPALFASLPDSPRTSNPYPTPRGWDAVARLCGPECRCSENAELISGLVGEDAAEALVRSELISPTLEEVASTADPVERGLKLIMYMAMRFCAERPAAERLARAMEGLEPGVLVAASYLASHRCPGAMVRYHDAAARLGVELALLRGRAALSEETVEAGVEVLEDLL